MGVFVKVWFFSFSFFFFAPRFAPRVRVLCYYFLLSCMSRSTAAYLRALQDCELKVVAIYITLPPTEAPNLPCGQNI